MDAITTHALPKSVEMPQFIRAKAAVTAFSYLYMILRQDGTGNQSTFPDLIDMIDLDVFAGPVSASRLVLRFPSEQA
jgi:hypothetical protein